jgi:hydrogenase maturation protein HypF
MNICRNLVVVEGIVQGVGFRPFIYNLAKSLDLKGYVNNNSEGVHIELEGQRETIDEFLRRMKDNPPPLARIEEVIIREAPVLNAASFVIKESEEVQDKITLISPDIAICKECEEDINTKSNRRSGYAFTNCTNCGPRFSIIKALPYDRDKTTMQEFEMCEECTREYSDPENRRFHAQPNACPDCGPELWIEDNEGNKLEIDDPISFTQAKILEGKLFAIKGIGGFHLACDAWNDEAVQELRKRKRRPFKPLAVMMKDVETVKKLCHLTAKEEESLAGIRKPIVILDRKQDYDLPQIIAPHQHTLGVMLPYTPLHCLLFSAKLEVLIMTSANVHGLPIEHTDSGARQSLSGIVDYFLMHNREIYLPIDDSIVRVVEEKQTIIRRARGFAPEPFKALGIREILACGPNMKNTFCIGKEGFLFLSQFNGDLENIETFEHYQKNIEHFKKVFSFSPKFIVHDMHPEYLSTKYALTYDLPKIAVQHHHAHIVSCMFENKLAQKVIGVCYDGTGYGTDGRIWGGEFMICDRKEFTRVGHLDYLKMPGGEKAIKEPWRMGISYLYKALESDEKVSRELLDLYGERAEKLVPILDANINCPQTSSMGRLFDAVSNIMGIADKVTYEGQAAIELETVAEAEIEEAYSYKITKEDSYIIEFDEMIREIAHDRFKGVSVNIMAAKFQNTIVNMSVKMCRNLREDTGLNDVVLSGGVFQNSCILTKIFRNLAKEGFLVYTHSYLPSNDGGVAIGQIIIADELIGHDLH